MVTKIPRWPFDKFARADRRLGTQMKATGEVMAIERPSRPPSTRPCAAWKTGGRTLLWEDPEWAANEAAIWWRIEHAHDERLWAVMAALRRSATAEEIARRSGIDRFFVDKLANILATERRLLADPLTPNLVWHAKRQGFSDAMIASLGDTLPERVLELREAAGIRPTFKMVDTCAAEFDAATPYFLEHLRDRERGRSQRPARGRRAWQRPDPHRTGHRVRLLLRALGLGPGRRWPRERAHQFQP